MTNEIIMDIAIQTIAMSYLAAFVSVLYSVEMILIALGMTAMVTIIIAFIATFSKVLLSILIFYSIFLLLVK